MTWIDLQKSLVSEVGFSDRIKVSKDESPRNDFLHPIIIQSVGLLFKLLKSEKNNRLALIFPNKNDIAKWMSVFTSLQIMKQDYQNLSHPEIKFEKGQKLRIGNLIVEFEGENYDPHCGLMLSIRSRVGRNSYQIDTFPWTEKLYFEKVTTSKNLSSTIKVQEMIIAIRKEAPKIPIDTILKIKTLGNNTFFKRNIILSSLIRETVSFLSYDKINGNKISDLFSWGKIDIEGDASDLSSQIHQDTYSALVSTNLFGVTGFLEKRLNNTAAVIIDGTSRLADELPLLDELIEKSPKTVIIADLSDMKNIQYLSDRGFLIWQWKSDSIIACKAIQPETEISPNSVFYSLNKSLRHYCGSVYVTEICIYPEIENIISWTLKVVNTMGENWEILNELKWDMVSIANDIARLVYLPEEQWFLKLKERINIVRDSIKHHSQWLSGENLEYSDQLLNILDKFVDNGLREGSGKIFKLKALIDEFILDENSENSRLIILLPKNGDVVSCEKFWGKFFLKEELSKVSFLKSDDYLDKDETFENETVVICGWLGSDDMTQLKNNMQANNAVLLFYSKENDWYSSAQITWKKLFEYKMRPEDFSDLLGEAAETIKFIAEEPKTEAPPVTGEDITDIVEFERRLKTFRFTKYGFSSNNVGETVEAKLVLYGDEWFSIMSENHKITVVTDLIKEKNVNTGIQKLTVNELQKNDYVLFTESDRDIIREIADKMLSDIGKSELKQNAELWRMALREEYNAVDRDINRLYSRLSYHGCQKSLLAVKQWLFDKNIIGPKNINDIDIIANATGNRALIEHKEEVKFAIEHIRSAHFRASDYLIGKLYEVLPAILNSKENSLENNKSERFVIPLENYGNAYLLKVEEVADEWGKVDISKTNKLLRTGENY